MILPVVILLSGALAAQSPAFDYYVLSLTWAPERCAEPGIAVANPKECASGRGIGFVVHGLWPESAQGKSPESCGPAKRVPKNVVNIALPYMSSESLIQSEWATHGVCTGMSQSDYFFAVIQARSAVQIPVQMISLEAPLTESPELIESQFAAANTDLPKAAFRAVCRNGVLSEVRVCFNRDLKPAECPIGVGECPVPSVTIRPPR